MRNLGVTPPSVTVGRYPLADTGFKGQESRAKKRFRISLPVTYKAVKGKGEGGNGCTLNMSSAGICFTTQAPLPTGIQVELSLPWPVRLDESIPMKLVIEAVVVRASATDAAARIRSYEFRTQRQKPTVRPAELAQWATRHL
jgi:PilZ domain